MLSGSLQTSIETSKSRISVALHLLDLSQVEKLFFDEPADDSTSQPAGRSCSAEPAAPACTFHAAELQASAVYYMVLVHAGSQGAADAGGAIAEVTAAFSGASSCGSLQCPGVLELDLQRKV